MSIWNYAKSWVPDCSGCFTKATNMAKSAGTYVYRGLLLGANTVSLPFSLFLWRAIWNGTYTDFYETYIKENWHAPIELAGLMKFILGVRIACSSLLDITCTDLINLSFSGESSKKAGLCHPIKLLYHLFQLFFLFTAGTYAASYVTGINYLTGGSTAIEIFETLIFGGLGTLYYFLFTNKDLEEHAFSIPNIWPNIRRCFKDENGYWRIDGVQLARLIVCSLLIFSTAFYRSILGGNDWLSFKEAMTYLSGLSDTTIKKIYLALLANVFISTLVSRTRAVTNKYLPRALTPHEEMLKHGIPLTVNDLQHTFIPLMMSAGIAFLLRSNPINAGIAGISLFTLQVLVAIDIGRTHKAIDKANPLLDQQASVYNNDASSFSATITKLSHRKNTCYYLTLLIVILGRSTRLDALVDFIKTNDSALDRFAIASFNLSLNDRMALALILGSSNIINDIGLYGSKALRRVNELLLRVKITATEYNKPYLKSFFQNLIFDWKQSSEINSNSVNSTISHVS